MYLSVLQLFLAVFYRYNQDYIEIFSANNADGTPLTVTGDTIIKVVDSPDKYVLRYQPLPEEQRKFLRGLAERALYPGRPIQLRQGETASLRNRVASLLRYWSGDQVPVAARQATADELSSILEDTPKEIVQTAAALMEIAMQPQEAATAKALLEDLPLKVGLTADSSEWDDQRLDQALAYQESACQALRNFEKAFKKHMAWQIGQYFGLTKPPGNWNDTLTAALTWRKNVVKDVSRSNLGGAPDSRDLLDALDEEPHSFEQVFLIRLAHNWHFSTFEQWRTISVRDEYLVRLEQAKTTVENRADELGVLAEPPSEIDRPTTPTTDSEKPLSTQPPETSTDTLAGSIPDQESQQPDSSVTEAPVEQKPPVQAQPGELPSSSVSSEEQAVTEAIKQITTIIENLSRKDQYTLWEKLCEIYDSR